MMEINSQAIHSKLSHSRMEMTRGTWLVVQRAEMNLVCVPRDERSQRE
jgi:hypothetical protein